MKRANPSRKVTEHEKWLNKFFGIFVIDFGVAQGNFTASLLITFSYKPVSTPFEAYNISTQPTFP